jgi:hypothetical protein
MSAFVGVLQEAVAAAPIMRKDATLFSRRSIFTLSRFLLGLASGLVNKNLYTVKIVRG